MLNHKLITASSCVKLAEADIEAIEEIVGWNRPAFFPKPGRSAWLKLKEPVTVSQGHSYNQIKSIKIKGVGLCNQYGDQLEPCSEPYYRHDFHLGFATDGKFIHVESPPAPMGGMTLDRGFAEFFISSNLNQHNCPAQVPLLIYQYDEPEMTFKSGENISVPLCVTVTGLPNDNWFRVREIDKWMMAEPNSENRQDDEYIFQVLDTWANSLNITSQAYKPLATTASLFYLYGQTLRKFHEIGYYRHNGGTHNFIYSPETRAVYFTDLDSSRPIVECSSVTAPLQLMRDVASPLSRITYRLTNNMLINKISPELIFENDSHNLYKNLLLGYYHDVSVDAIEAVVNCIKEDFGNRYSVALQRHACRDKNVVNQKMSYQEYSDKLGDLYWVDFEELFPFFTAVVWDLHEQGMLGKQYPHQLRKSDMYDSIGDLISLEFVRHLKQGAFVGVNL